VISQSTQRGARRVPCHSARALLAGLALVVAGTSVASAAGVLEPGRSLPATPLVTLDGVETDLDSLRGTGPSLVVFWGTWCQPCRREVPALNELLASGEDRGLSILGVAMAEPLAVVSAASTQLKMSYPVAVATDADAAAAMGVDRVPLLVLLDDRGRIAQVAGGVDASLRAEVERLLGGGRAPGGGLLAGLTEQRAPFPFAGVLLAPDFWKSALFWLPIPLLGLLFFYSIIIIHCCSHDDLTPSRRLNAFIGELLSAPNLFMFREFTALHVMHHAFTNDETRDPHWVRPGEGWIHYVVTQYPRLVAFTFSEEYRKRCWAKNWEGVDFDSPELARHDRVAKFFGSSGRLQHPLWVLPLASIFGGLTLWMVVGTLLWGLPFLALMFGWWLLPWAIGQILVADFNWRGHVGLAARQDIANKDYVGQDTRSYYQGLWRFVNWATFGFYLHREHHVVPRVCMGMKEDAAVRAAQEAEEAALQPARPA
jgi:fatty acid desaturase/peroxiredoxin